MLKINKIIGLVFIVLMLCYAQTEGVSASQVGQSISDESGRMFYTITSSGDRNTCALTEWNNDISDDNEYPLSFVIPDKILYEGTEYTVTEIAPKYQYTYICANEIVIPSSVEKIRIKHISAELYKNADNYNDALENGIKIVFKCKPSAFEEIKGISVDADAISSIMFVPLEYLDEYKTLFNEKTQCVFYDNDITTRSYTGLPVYALGESEILPDGFIYQESFYKILDKEKKTVSLIKKPAGIDNYKNDGFYEQPSKVYYKDMEFIVVKIDYYAFCDAMWPSFCRIKLPSTVKVLESKSFGWNVTSIDLSETCIEEIPSYLFNSVYDEFDERPYVDEVLLPDTCKKINKKAFYNCKRLKSISLPSSLKKIGKKAFFSKCRKYYVNGDSFPGGLEKQDMKSAKVYVPEKLLDIAKDKLKVKIKQDKCKIVCIK